MADNPLEVLEMLRKRRQQLQPQMPNINININLHDPIKGDERETVIPSPSA